MYPKKNKGFVHVLVLIVVVLGIGLLGYFSWQKGLFKFRPSNFDSSPTLPQTRDDNLNNVVDENLPPSWKTFTNNELGFSVNYPPDFKIGGTENSNSVSVSPDTDKIKMTNNLYGRMEITQNGSFRETDVLTQLSIGEKYYQPSEDNFESKKGDYVTLTRVEDTKIGSNTAQTFQGDMEDKPIIIYILPHSKGNLIIEIKWWATGTKIDESQPHFLKTFDQILSTFKFLE